MSKIEEGQNILRGFRAAACATESSCRLHTACPGWRDGTTGVEHGRRLLRVHDIIQFINANYDRDYKENTRESIRKFVLHQFEQAGIVERNPDGPPGPRIVGKTAALCPPQAQAVIVLYDDSRQFLTAITKIQENHPALLEIYRAARTQHVVVDCPPELKAFLSPGKHNKLQKAIIDEFWPRFIPNAKLLYLGDTAKKDYYVRETRWTGWACPGRFMTNFPTLFSGLKSRIG